MKLTAINLPFDEASGFDATALDSFCAAHIVTAWTDHFFLQAAKPELVVLFEYKDQAESRRKGAVPRREREPRKELPAGARPLYDRLREWRSLRARQDGVPVYVVFNNRELAKIASAQARRS